MYMCRSMCSERRLGHETDQKPIGRKRRCRWVRREKRGMSGEGSAKTWMAAAVRRREESSGVA